MKMLKIRTFLFAFATVAALNTVGYASKDSHRYFRSYIQAKTPETKSEICSQSVVADEKKIIVDSARFVEDLLPPSDLDKIFSTCDVKSLYELDHQGFTDQAGRLYYRGSNPNCLTVLNRVLTKNPDAKYVAFATSHAIARIRDVTQRCQNVSES